MNMVDAMYAWVALVAGGDQLDHFDINTIVRIIDGEYPGGMREFHNNHYPKHYANNKKEN